MKYTVTRTARMTESRLAVGVHTGTLYMMIGRSTGMVVVGRGEMAGKEGQAHHNNPSFFERLPVGALVEIEA